MAFCKTAHSTVCCQVTPLHTYIPNLPLCCISPPHSYNFCLVVKVMLLHRARLCASNERSLVARVVPLQLPSLLHLRTCRYSVRRRCFLVQSETPHYLCRRVCSIPHMSYTYSTLISYSYCM